MTMRMEKNRCIGILKSHDRSFKCLLGTGSLSESVTHRRVVVEIKLGNTCKAFRTMPAPQSHSITASLYYIMSDPCMWVLNLPLGFGAESLYHPEYWAENGH